MAPFYRVCFREDLSVSRVGSSDTHSHASAREVCLAYFRVHMLPREPLAAFKANLFDLRVTSRVD